MMNAQESGHTRDMPAPAPEQDYGQRYGQLFENLCEGFAVHEMVYDRDGRAIDYRFLEVNPAFERMTGLKRADVEGRTVLQVLPGTEDYWIKNYAQVAETGVPIRFDNYSAALGRHFEVIAFSPSKGRFATLFLDITARKRGEEDRERLMAELRRRTIELEAVIESTHASLALLDRDLRFAMVNTAYAAGSGHSRASLIGRNHFDVFPNQDNEVIFRRVLETGEPYHANAREFRFADQPERGSTFWNWSLVPVRTDDHQIAGVLLSLLDVTPQVQALASLRNLERDREEFTRIVAHDIRQPLSAVSNSAEVLLKLLPEAAQRERRAAQRIVTGAHHMSSMITDLVESARLETGKVVMEKRAVDLVAIVRETLPMLGAQASRVSLVCEIPVAAVMGDALRLERAVGNLLSNALKYSDAQVDVRLWCERGCAKLSVRDRGPGIPENELPRVFERYYRAAGSTSSSEGLGLGLYISRLIVEALGGSISVASTPGDGSTFEITLESA